MSKYYLGDAYGIARRIKKMYFGVEAQVPVYETTSITVDETLTTSNYDSFFDVGTGSTSATSWTFISGLETGIKLKSGSNSYDTAKITLTAKKRIYGVTITNAATSSYSKYCDLAIAINGVWVMDSTAWDKGTEEFWSGNLDAGDSILLWCNMALGSAMNYYLIVSSAEIGTTYTESVQTGTETKGIARLAPRAYYSVNGVAKYWWNGVPHATYTGEHTITDVTLDGESYKLYTLTSAGTLTIGGDAQFWMCGGGASGARAQYSAGYYMGGYGGGGGYIATGTLEAGEYTVDIGLGGAASTSGGTHNAGGDTTITGGETTYTAAGASDKNGASGGGGRGNSYASSSGSRFGSSGGTGQGVSTIPFGIESLGAHCAGGGGGAGYYYANGVCYGGAGGADGADGTAGSTTAPSDTSPNRAPGGEVGGGSGGGFSYGQTYCKGEDATFYGGGGGGGTSYYPGSDAIYGNGGAGYQGVVHILVKA